MGAHGNGPGSTTTSAGANGRPSAGAPVGVIFGDVTTSQFRFAVHHPAVQATMYVSFLHDGSSYLAQVLRVEREDAGAGQTAWGGAAPDASDGPGDRLVAKATIIGKRSGRGRIVMPNTPPRPGSDVQRASPELVREVLNLAEKGAYLGMLRGLDLAVNLDIDELVQKHCSILAKTGAGKSYALGVLMEEALNNGVPIVVADPHGEHASLAAPNASQHELPLMRRFKVRPKSYGERVVEYVLDPAALPDGVPFQLDGRNLTAREISDLLAGSLTAAQLGVVHQAIRDLKDEGSYGLEDIIAGVEAQSGSAKWPVLHALEDLADLGLFSDEPTPARRLVAEGQATILNMKGAPPHVQDMVVARVTRDLFEARKVGLVPPHLFVLEEAHNFCPERNLAKAASGDVIRTIASEGRKFGMGLFVVSQRPAKVDKNVLSQCNTQVILKVTNANDLKAISASVEGLPAGMEDEIQALPVGTALVSAPHIAVPLFCEVRPRQTRHGGASLSVVRRPEADADEDTEPPLQELGRVEPEPVAASTSESSSEVAFQEVAGGRVASGTPRAPPTAEDRMLEALEGAEALVARHAIDQLTPGRLERVLVEVEGLQEALAELMERPSIDHPRAAGLASRLGALRNRLVQLLRRHS